MYRYGTPRGRGRTSRANLVELATSRKLLEQQVTGLAKQRSTLHSQARIAIASDREDLARAALLRRAGLVDQIEQIVAQHAELSATEATLTKRVIALGDQIRNFGTRKTTIIAMHDAAMAHAGVADALAGLGPEFSDAGRAVGRAQERIGTMQARDGALHELRDRGVLPDALSGPDRLTREIESLTAPLTIEAELEAMRESLGTALPAVIARS
jgi:phage shock protein A